CVRTECSSVLVAGPVALRHANVHLARTPEETLRARSRTRSKPFRRRDRREGADRAVRGVGEGARLAVLAALLVVANHVQPRLQRRVGRGGPAPDRARLHTRDGRIHHRWSSELFAAPRDPGQHPRHVDYMWPIWKVLDVTPDGRGADWHPRYRYDT